MTSGTAVLAAAHPMAWTNERLKLSCADGIGFKSLWKMLVLDKNGGAHSKNDVSARTRRFIERSVSFRKRKHCLVARVSLFNLRTDVACASSNVPPPCCCVLPGTWKCQRDHNIYSGILSSTQRQIYHTIYIYAFYLVLATTTPTNKHDDDILIACAHLHFSHLLHRATPPRLAAPPLPNCWRVDTAMQSRQPPITCRCSSAWLS